MTIDDEYLKADMREQELTTQAAVLQERVEANAEAIEADDELIEAAISHEATDNDSWNERWRTEQAALFRARGGKDTDAMVEAAQGLCDLMDEAVDNLAATWANDGEQAA